MYSQPSNDINTLIKLIQISVPANMQLFGEGVGIPSLTGQNLEPVWTERANDSHAQLLEGSPPPPNPPDVSGSGSLTCFSVIA